jgi:7,8-dihydropterin-6-yl-methyl-4-(beta-D-ribofuranosyl)aminobenzene 5'-phosphate synthase
MSVKMTITVENKVGLGVGMIGEHGFSVILETPGKKILWDTGQGMALPNNLKRLNINPKQIETIALSHGHFDHTGGLHGALQEAEGCEVVCHPACFDKKKTRRVFFGKEIEVPIGIPQPKEQLEKAGANWTFVKDTMEIAPGVHFVTNIPMKNDFETIEPGFFIETDDGPVDDTFKDDASLAVITENGLSIILGCAHKGIINHVSYIMEKFNVDKVHSIWGGTHMVERTEEEVEKTIQALKAMNFKTLATAHCTGFENEAKLATKFPGQFAFAHVGVMAEL